jgi:hypothetical protein
MCCLRAPAWRSRGVHLRSTTRRTGQEVKAPIRSYHSDPDWRTTMGTEKSTKPTILDIETLNGISAQLHETADGITQVTLRDLAHSIRLAARCAQVLAHIRFELGEIAEKTKDHDTRLELRGLLDDASVAEPSVGQP